MHGSFLKVLSFLGSGYESTQSGDGTAPNSGISTQGFSSHHNPSYYAPSDSYNGHSLSNLTSNMEPIRMPEASDHLSRNESVYDRHQSQFQGLTIGGVAKGNPEIHHPRPKRPMEVRAEWELFDPNAHQFQTGPTHSSAGSDILYGETTGGNHSAWRDSGSSYGESIAPNSSVFSFSRHGEGLGQRNGGLGRDIYRKESKLQGPSGFDNTTGIRVSASVAATAGAQNFQYSSANGRTM